jgi:alpha-methylacyl-CoA racemase
VPAPGPLSDLKVLDLSRLLPGPYATLVLADLGAQVDKVEDPQVGDPVRLMPPHWGEESAFFATLNRNKRSLVLDLKRPECAAALKRLSRRYDVLVESFRPGVMERLGLSYATLAAENPRLIYCSITGFGQTGPDRLRAGHDVGYIARAGVLGHGGPRDGAPAMPGVQIADIGGGSLFGLIGILAALHERDRTGRGQAVDISMTDGALAFLHMQLSARALLGEEAAPMRRGGEPLNGGYPGYNIYRTQDGRYLAVGALEPKFLTALLHRVGREDLLHEAYDLGEGGRKVRAELERVFGAQPLAHWRKALGDADACVEVVQEPDEVLGDAQLRERGMFVTAHDELTGREVTYVRTPVHLGEVTPRRAPTLGQHSREILVEAGFTPDEMTTLGV